MPPLWQEVHPSQLGFPALPIEAAWCPPPKVKISAWIKGMRVNTADWHLVARQRSLIENYFKAGGRADRLIIHHFYYDDEGIEPLWNKSYLVDQVKMMKDFGVKYFIAPQFSDWGNMPLVVRMYQLYRSTVVCRDMIELGDFKTIPHFYDYPSARTWGNKLPGMICDIGHGGEIGKRHAMEWWRDMVASDKVVPTGRLLLWSAGPRKIQDALDEDKRASWVPSSGFWHGTLTRELGKHKHRPKKSSSP